MARYIDADKAKHEFNIGFGGVSHAVIANQIIDSIPTADVVEVKHGYWKVAKTEFGWNCCEYPTEFACSLCGRTVKQKENYCHCGAKMDGGIKNDNT